MERVIQLARPLKGKKREETELQEYKKEPEKEKSVFKNGNLNNKNTEADYAANGQDSKPSQARISRIQNEEDQRMKSREQEDSVLETDETQNKKKSKDVETSETLADEVWKINKLNLKCFVSGRRNPKEKEGEPHKQKSFRTTKEKERNGKRAGAFIGISR